MPAYYRKGPVICAYCGKPIENAMGSRKYHLECAKLVSREYDRKRKRTTNKTRSAIKEEAEEKRARKGPSLSEIMCEANKEGLQYAEYCKKHNLY